MSQASEMTSSPLVYKMLCFQLVHVGTNRINRLGLLTQIIEAMANFGPSFVVFYQMQKKIVESLKTDQLFYLF
jgi:hypothetical protein